MNANYFWGYDNVYWRAVCISDLYFYPSSADASQDGALDRFKTKIVLSSNGRNMWLSPVIYTFSCKINVNFFPFDEQVSFKHIFCD